MSIGRGKVKGEWTAYLHEALGTRLCDGTEVVNEVGFGHANTCIADAEELVVLVRGDADVEVGFGFEGLLVGKRGIADLVEGVGGIGDDFTKEDLLVGVKGVYRWALDCGDSRGGPRVELRRTDDEIEELADLSLEAKAFGHFVVVVLSI